jgi:hypothetical protein
MNLLYFAHFDGSERLLRIEFDRKSLSVNFKFDQDKDPAHEEESENVEPVSVSASVRCSNIDQFDGFGRALVPAMRRTSFSLQDPSKPPFARMDADDLKLDEFGKGVPPKELTCRIPAKIVPHLIPSGYVADEFKPLIEA